MLVFKCPTGWCGKEASTLDAMALVQPDGYHCDVCDAVLEPLSTTHPSGGLSKDQRQALLALQVWLGPGCPTPAAEPAQGLLGSCSPDAVACRVGQGASGCWWRWRV